MKRDCQRKSQEFFQETEKHIWDQLRSMRCSAPSARKMKPDDKLVESEVDV